MALGASVALALGLAACGGGAGAPSASDTAFLANVHNNAPDISSYRSDTELERLGRAACAGFSSHASYEQLADRLTLDEGGDPLPSEDLGVVIDAAVQAYCPQFHDDVS